jgi:hypothetical protein
MRIYPIISRFCRIIQDHKNMLIVPDYGVGLNVVFD